MFNPTQIVIKAFVDELQVMYAQTYGILEPSYPGIMGFVARLALENIATSDAAYHDVNHTIMVTLVGQEILRGRHISVGGVTPASGCISSSRCYATTSDTFAGSAVAIAMALMSSMQPEIKLASLRVLLMHQ